jgi:hypothetical protein
MWYTANSTDSESVDLIMKSIIFFFWSSPSIFFRSSNSVDDKLVSVGEGSELWGRIVEKISDQSIDVFGEIVGFTNG